MSEIQPVPIENAIMRWGGRALLAAGLLLLIFCFLHPHSVEQHIDESHFWALVLSLFVPTLLLSMVGFTALMLRHQRAMGLVGMVGYVALVVPLPLFSCWLWFSQSPIGATKVMAWTCCATLGSSPNPGPPARSCGPWG